MSKLLKYFDLASKQRKDEYTLTKGQKAGLIPLAILVFLLGMAVGQMLI